LPIYLPKPAREVSSGLKSWLEYLLDQICADAEARGTHEMCNYITNKLMLAAQAGNSSLEELTQIAQDALADFLRRADHGSNDPEKESPTSMM
jgi:hypothetical protein